MIPKYEDAVTEKDQDAQRRSEDATTFFVKATADHPGRVDEKDPIWSDHPEHNTMTRLVSIAQGADNLRPHYREEIETLKNQARRRQAVRQWSIVSLVSGIAAAMLIVAFGWRTLEADSQTPISHTLADQSVIHIDAGGVVEVPFAPWKREARWLQGDALFEVTHNVDRPFVVHVTRGQVMVLGTRFLVQGTDDAVRVSVFEGLVDMNSNDQTSMLLPAGQAAALTATDIANIPMLDETLTTSWRTGRLVFRDTPLEHVAARMSRYRDEPVVVNDPIAAGLTISGSFRLEDTDGILKTLELALPVKVRYRPGETVIEANSVGR